MTEQLEIVGLVIEGVVAIQMASGRTAEGLDATTDLLTAVEGFDSLNCLEVLMFVGARLDAELPDALLGLDSGSGKLSVADLSSRISAEMENDHGKH